MGGSLIRGLVAVVLALLPSFALAKDVAMILDDRKQAELRQILDLATKAYGLQIAPATIELMNELAKAPVVTEHKDTPADTPPQTDTPPPKDDGAPK